MPARPPSKGQGSGKPSPKPTDFPLPPDDQPEAGPSSSSSSLSIRSRASSPAHSTGSRKGKERAVDPQSESESESESESARVSGESESENENENENEEEGTHSNGPSEGDSSDDEAGEDEAVSENGELGGHGTIGKNINSTANGTGDEGDVDGSDHGSDQDHEEEDEEDEEDEDEDDEDDEEPALKYSRLKGKVPEILAKDSASTIAVSPRVVALGTHNGMVHVLTYEGAKVNSFRPHAASVTCLRMDEENDFVATSSVEGRVVIHSLTSTESYAFDYKRPMRAIALEPGFAKKNTRAFVCGGMAGNLILQEKGWLGYKEQILHSGEGPIWAIEWRGNLIAWANDLGVKLYDTTTGQRIGYIDRGANAPRAELFKCTLQWKDDHTLIIGWAEHIKIVRIRARAKSQTNSGLPPLTVEMTAIYQVDCMISGIAQYQSSYVVLAYIAPDTYSNEATDNPAEQRRKAANRPELRLIDKGEEVNADALSLANYHMYGCNDYSLVRSQREGEDVFFVVSPSDVIVVRPRDEVDHIDWLVERERYEEALTAAEELQKKHGNALDVRAIGLKYMQHLLAQGHYDQTASLAPKVLGQDVELWEKWIYIFVQHQQLPAIIPYIPTSSPQLGKPVYEMVFGHLLVNDRVALLKTITSWPTDIYDLNTVMGAVQGELTASKDEPILLECLGELHLINRQPAKALPYFLRLRRPYVFDLIKEHNLFTAVQDQALLLVQFDQEREHEKVEVEGDKAKNGAAIQLLVDHTHSIPIDRVVNQLEAKPKYLYMYLDSLFDKDPQLSLPYSDRMVELYAAFDVDRLMPFLRASNFYDLEKAYKTCKERDYVPEMVFLLGRMGNNKKALMLIIERLGDVQRAIDFAKEQSDEDLWEDLLTYSETRPSFIRALLEHVGAEINPIRLISRIKNGLEIPGLKEGVVRVLQSMNLQVSLLEGCQHILNGDCSNLASELQAAQVGSIRGSPSSMCPICTLPLFPAHTADSSLVLIYLCHHVVHASCALPDEVDLPPRQESTNLSYLLSSADSGGLHGTLLKGSGGGKGGAWKVRQLGGKLGYAAAVRVRVGRCPVCEKRGRGGGSNTLGVSGKAVVPVH
ncbi:vacuolar protein sorting 41 [Kwoniella heveanensis BCC8398]|uniref:Vacuolar protein sorting 41 n=1 Tax=Kwoniella heveanensis BCC8398 TaxID=1296120 RepID=A0A1B9H474_9TREE|nr:vacuolar protein sorting 41 [Kwoniella heveanensis BCC8398]